MKKVNAGKELYKQLRALPWPRLWGEEVARFDRATPRERFETVSVIRAVGVVFSESGPDAQRGEVRRWLRSLLHDPEEKVRRYAMAALPKIGAGAGEEAELLGLMRSGTNEREKKFLGRTLDKIGGEATLKTLAETGALPAQTEQKVRAAVARGKSPGIIRMDGVISDFADLRIHLRGRAGLEDFVREEVAEQGKFRVVEVRPGLVAVMPAGPFTLGDLFELRCFGTAGFVLGVAKPEVDALAHVIASLRSQRLLAALTTGAIRYRLDFVAEGHQRGRIRDVANRAYALCPTILNDAREAPWAIDIHPGARGDFVELRPRLSPDPRHAWRLGDVPAASHPPLAACMARLAGRRENESVWDPFCGSGLELVERASLGGVRRIFGSDLSAGAIDIARRNLAGAKAGVIPARFACCDFRDFPRVADVPPRSLTLIISNPPLGRRVPIRNLRGLFDDLFAVAADMLAPGGRLVFTNPLRMESPEPSLKLQSRRAVDLGGFECSLELYHKVPRR